MRVSSHQPAFLPWAGFWHKALSVDQFVLSAGVQWAKDGYLNRTNHQGAWITIPVSFKDGDPICEVKVADQHRMITKARKTLEQIPGPHRTRLEPLIHRLSKVLPNDTMAYLNAGMILDIGLVLGKPAEHFPMLLTAGCGETKTARLNSRITSTVPSISSFYMGRGTASYFDPEEFKDVPCFVQDPSSFENSPSIVQLISQEPDPVDWIMSRGRWAELAR